MSEAEFMVAIAFVIGAIGGGALGFVLCLLMIDPRR